VSQIQTIAKKPKPATQEQTTTRGKRAYSGTFKKPYRKGRATASGSTAKKKRGSTSGSTRPSTSSTGSAAFISRKGTTSKSGRGVGNGGIGMMPT